MPHEKHLYIYSTIMPHEKHLYIYSTIMLTKNIIILKCIYTYILL